MFQKHKSKKNVDDNRHIGMKQQKKKNEKNIQIHKHNSLIYLIRLKSWKKGRKMQTKETNFYKLGALSVLNRCILKILKQLPHAFVFCL